jgi:hypothetical protein
MERGVTASRTLITPRLMTRQQAASYCGISVATFSANCPVAPVALGEGKRLERYDVRALDAWIDNLREMTDSMKNQRSWLGLVEKPDVSRSR